MSEDWPPVLHKELFKAGVVVKLKSGGPAMTVEMWRPDDLVCTQWFDENKHVRDAFDPNCLVLA